MILDDDVVVFARVVSSAFGTAVYGYGILSNYYMQGQKDAAVANNIVSLGKWSQVFGVILMDSTYNNIKVGLCFQGCDVENQPQPPTSPPDHLKVAQKEAKTGDGDFTGVCGG